MKANIRKSPAWSFLITIVPVWLFSSFWLTSEAQNIKVENIGFDLKDEVIEIRYDLIGNPEKTYKISVELKREGDPGFRFTPTRLAGDAGKGKYAGNGRKIVWNFTDEFKPEAGVDDYYFEISAKKVSRAWLWILSGGVVAGGATAAVLLLTGKEEEVPAFPVPSRP